MKKIVFVGDSLTWCENPTNKKRHVYDDRWVTIVTKAIKEREVNAISLPGLAIKKNWWAEEVDWYDTDHLFIEKSLKSYEEDMEDLFLFLGTNNIGPEAGSDKLIQRWYQELIDNVLKWIADIKNIYVMLLPNMSGVYSSGFSLEQLNEKFRQLKNISGVVDLSQIKIESKDNIHFSIKNNKEVANKIIEFIRNKGDYK